MTSKDQFSGWTEKKLQKCFTKPNFHQKKKSWSLFGGLLPVWSITALWILAKPLHLRSMLSKLMRYTKNYDACSWHWSTEWAQFFSTTMLTACHTTNTSKVDETGLQNFASTTIFPWLLSCQLTNTSLSVSPQQLFAGKMPAGGRTYFPRVPWLPKHNFLCSRNKQAYFSLTKMCLL